MQMQMHSTAFVRSFGSFVRSLLWPTKEQKSTKLLYHQCHDAALRCAVVAVVAVVAVAVVAFVVAVIVAAVAAVVAVVVVIAVVIVVAVAVGGGGCQCIVMSLYNSVTLSMLQRMHAIPLYHCIIVRHGINGPTDKPRLAECPWTDEFLD